MRDPKGTKKDLQKLCQQKNLPIKFCTEIVEEGWLGKPKGAFQVLFERGWIDPSNLSKYTEKGRHNEMGVLLEHMSIKLLMQKQQDFMSEVTLLQFHGSKLGVTIDRSPKCHPEIAGEGIEFLWAISKLYYRSQPISRKRTKNDFLALVKESFSADVIDVPIARACSRRCREYMLMYSAVDRIHPNHDDAKNSKNENPTQNRIATTDPKNDNHNENINHALFEKSIKLYKSHRSMADSDSAVIKRIAKKERKMKNEMGDKKAEIVKKVVENMNVL